jgi:hypothetical protein
MADRVIFQMDQATSEDKKLLWKIRKCCKNTSMDSNICLCACGDNQKTTEFRDESLHFFADFEYNDFRETPYFTST